MGDITLSDKIARSVDSLERIYAVVVALAVTIAVQAFLFDQNGHILPYSSTTSPSVASLLSENGANLLAFIITTVPFYHGMQRHLNQVYIERTVTKGRQGFLLLDFFAFFLESCLLLAFAASVTSGVDAFIPLMVLLLIDLIWAIIAHGIHYGEWRHAPWKWAAINFITVIFIWFCYHGNWFPSDSIKLWSLAFIAVARTAADYGFTWKFYFPDS